MDVCTTRERPVDIDVLYGGIMSIGRDMRLQVERHQSLDRKIDSVMETINGIMQTQRGFTLDMSVAVKKEVEPLAAKLNRLADETVRKDLNRLADETVRKDYLEKVKDPRDRKGDEELESVFKKHLHPIQSYLNALHEHLSKSPKVQEIGGINSARSAEEFRLFLRQELQAHEKAVMTCMDEKLKHFAQPVHNEQQNGMVIKPEPLHKEPQNGMVMKQQNERMNKRDGHHYNDIQADQVGHPAEFGNVQSPDLQTDALQSALTKTPLLSTRKERPKLRLPKLRMTQHAAKPLPRLKFNNSLSLVFRCHTDVSQKAYRPDDYYRDDGFCQRVARDPRFDHVTSFVVALSAIYLGIESDTNEAANLYNGAWIFIFCSTCFMLYFIAELSVRFFAFRRPEHAFKDGWFRFDLFLVSLMVVENWVLMPLLYALQTDGFKVSTKPLRLMRILKILRMTRLMKAFPELVTMVLGLARSLRAIVSTLIMLMLLMYVWAILLHGLLRGEDDLNHYLRHHYEFEFDTLGHCLWTLLMDGVLQLDNAALVMTTLMFDPDFKVVVSGIAFTIFSLISSLLILQMLIGVMCDVVATVGREQRKAKTVAIVQQELLTALSEQATSDGFITKPELEACMEAESSLAVFKHLKINPQFVRELASLYYTSGDGDGEQRVNVKSFLDLLMLCQGDSVVTVDLLATVTAYLDSELVGMENRLIAHIDHEVTNDGGPRSAGKSGVFEQSAPQMVMAS